MGAALLSLGDIIIDLVASSDSQISAGAAFWAASAEPSSAGTAGTHQVTPAQPTQDLSARVVSLRTSVLLMSIPVGMVLVGGWMFRWVQEDAFIDIRIIQNLLNGHGPVYNVGQRVEVYSDPLWLYIQALLHLIFPFVSIEFTEVISGVLFTALGVVLSGLAMIRLAASREESTSIPIGLIIFGSCAAVWEFETSGLEMSQVFLWIGLAIWLVVRVEAQQTSYFLSAFVIGLGPLIRPELALMSIVFGAVLVLLLGRGCGWAWKRLWKQELALIGCATAIPILYELFRMAYFGMLVPNTALAKSAGSTWWNQGFTYLWNFLSPYTLWLPLTIGVVLFLPIPIRWLTRHDYWGTLILLCPVAAGLLDSLYAVKVGGDYMHARLLLPGFMAVCSSLVVTRPNFRSASAVGLILISVWSVISIGWMRPAANEPVAQNIDDERTFWISYAHNAHPIYPRDFSDTFTYKWAEYMNQLASRTLPGHPLIVSSDKMVLGPARPDQTCRIVTDSPAMGLIGVVASSSVCIFDLNSLADPIGSHTVGTQRSRFGKSVSLAWMIAEYEVSSAPVNSSNIAAAERVVSCGVLQLYLRDISGTPSVADLWSNFTHSIEFTTFRISANPRIAVSNISCRPPPRHK